MTTEIIGAVILVVLSIFFYSAMKKDKKKLGSNKKNGTKPSKSKDKETVQELLAYEQISDRGVVKLINGTYTLTVEVSQINQRLMNQIENTTIWRKFRGMLNSIGIRHTYLVQSQYLDVMDFVSEYNENADELDNLTPELKLAKEDIVDNYKSFAEEKTREVRCYMIFRFNPKKDGMEKGLETGNSTLDGLLSGLKGQTNSMDKEEADELANSILDEVGDLAHTLLHSIGIKAIRLNKVGVLNMLYMTLNRDLTLSQRLVDVNKAQSFTEFKLSETPFAIEEEAYLSEIELVEELEKYIPIPDDSEISQLDLVPEANSKEELQEV
ncbi:hypothetical protein [Psychrobacillus sp. FSL H8-0487]|uniref:hypothetical protein n=1 Tax=Psychrobacillus sp. FSL H8-0487 TaxID=2921391 RepID=UPI0030F767DA